MCDYKPQSIIVIQRGNMSSFVPPPKIVFLENARSTFQQGKNRHVKILKLHINFQQWLSVNQHLKYN